MNSFFSNSIGRFNDVDGDSCFKLKSYNITQNEYFIVKHLLRDDLNSHNMLMLQPYPYATII